MAKIADWLKQNKFTAFLVALVLYLFFQGNSQILPSQKFSGYDTSDSSMMYAEQDIAATGGRVGANMVPSYNSAAPQPDIKNRMVATDATASVVVKNVRDSITQLKEKTVALGGYMVNANISQPQEGSIGTLQLRVPAHSLDEMLQFLRANSIRVVHEGVFGVDVTDEFVDVDERLAILQKNKGQLEQIMESATEVDDILRVQDSIFQVQSQIESLEGRLKYLEATSKTSSLSINLATDEYSLPYAPVDQWNASNIFKLAVRSLVITFREVLEFLIWAGVYAVIWIPLGLIGIVIYKKASTVKTPPQQ